MRISRRLGKIVRFMVSRLMENTFVSHLFIMPPTRDNSPPGSCQHPSSKGKLRIPPGTVFLKICFPQEKEESKLWCHLYISVPTVV